MSISSSSNLGGGASSHCDTSASSSANVVSTAHLPIDDAIGLRVNGGLSYGRRHPFGERFQETAGAGSGVAIGQNAVPVALLNLCTYQFCYAQYRRVHGNPAKRRAHRDHRGNSV